MTEKPLSYRWNTSAAAEAYDRAAPTIHPFYEAVQDQILARLPFATDEPFVAVDLGGGSGRLADKLLQKFSTVQVVVVDQSEPFLGLAEQRLEPFGARAAFIQRRLQDDWAPELPGSPDLIVSTSAIHHLEPAEKSALFRYCFDALSPGGLFVNGDEYRPESDGEFRALLEKWSRHMQSALDEGQIPESFGPTLELWYDRNIRRFGEPKKSGDDCLETAGAQCERLRAAGFHETDVAWAEELWGVVVARKDR